ncbi:uroporphyrinogen-III C-methyltransferase [Aeoliella mucimassa]|uniref:uroporphyrinogen-III C-methyltransferase n=1 Tax=Aeoliella mucimassa TaxID=2527972 RepID=A0A518AM80_9BACT|nr:uroporphyrinogen-III C-methyltransferase [Aeoliella mucimassa]QDU55830.1 Uroporphyrinogen-III C-methyltransferase [Aeoliella mucimassa]
MNPQQTQVYLVGAGPGDPRLITLRGIECLRRAEVVLYDYLASAELLRYAPESAERVCLGRHGTGRILTQQEVNRLMVEYAQAGKTVVRLKGGDPNIFGRLVEETSGLVAAGIAFEVVPGLTTAATAGCYAGVAITDRDEASCVAFVTGRERCGKEGDDSLDYQSLAQFPGTLVFYMGVTTAPVWSTALIAGGKSPDTPVAVVRHCSLPTQQTWTCTLGEVPTLLSHDKLRPPVIVIVGKVAQQQSLTEWFTSRPLFGQSILVTRAIHQADELGDQLRELGANVVYQPAIEITPASDWAPVDQAIARIESFDWLVFSSRNGVEYFLRRMWKLGHDWRALAHCQLAAIGPGTAAALAEHHLRVDCQPEEYRAEALAAELSTSARGQRFLLLRASRGREVLAETLSAAGGEVEQVVVYESHDVTSPAPEVEKALTAGDIDWVTATSSAIARSLVAMLGESLNYSQLAAISPLTGEVLRDLGFPPKVVASDYTMAGLVAAIEQGVAAARRPA